MEEVVERGSLGHWIRVCRRTVAPPPWSPDAVDPRTAAPPPCRSDPVDRRAV